MHEKVTLLVVGILLAADAGTSASEGPVAVSPSSASGGIARVESRCPTFSWGSSPSAGAYELVVYRVGEQEAELVLRHEIPGSASSWTPTLESCLDRGDRYAWAVRAVGAKGVSDWSPPTLFEVDLAPSWRELQEALPVGRRYRGETSAHSPEGRETSSSGIDERTEEGLSALSLPSIIGGARAAIQVTGEVRTIDSNGEPRLWGRGRPDSFLHGIVLDFCEKDGVSYGLTSVVTDWGSAAEVCPAGSWVCRMQDVFPGAGPCDTFRPDNTSDWLACDGTPMEFLNASNHRGWLANPSDRLNARVAPPTFNEQGLIEQGDLFSCASLPVWCCWE